MKQHFRYLGWDHQIDNPSRKYMRLYDDVQSTVQVTTSVGPYKNNYAHIVLQKNSVYYWEIKIIKGTYFKIGVIKHSALLDGFKGNAFSDCLDGYAYYSPGKLRNGSNSTGTDFDNGYGPGDIVKVCFNSKEGNLYFGKNKEQMKMGFTNEQFKKGGYIPAVSALMEGSKYSLTIPELED